MRQLVLVRLESPSGAVFFLTVDEYCALPTQAVEHTRARFITFHLDDEASPS